HRRADPGDELDVRLDELVLGLRVGLPPLLLQPPQHLAGPAAQLPGALVDDRQLHLDTEGGAGRGVEGDVHERRLTSAAALEKRLGFYRAETFGSCPGNNLSSI